METLKVETRAKSSNHDAKKRRRHGKIPGIIYGTGMTSILFEIGELELHHAISQKGEHGIVDVDVNGSEHSTIIKEVQRDPLSHKIIHIDLEEIQKDKKVTTTVPIHFVGEETLNRFGAVIQKEKANVKVVCKPESLPKFFELNVKEASIGTIYTVGDLEVASEISIIDDIDAVLGSVSYEQKLVEAVEPQENKKEK